jgi:phosphotransferase system HPr (HPr) family protein
VFARTVVVGSRAGLHARPATLFVETASRFHAQVRVTSGGQAVDAKTVLGLMLLEAVRGTAITITAEGDDEVAAVTALAELVERGFDEEEVRTEAGRRRRRSPRSRQ